MMEDNRVRTEDGFNLTELLKFLWKKRVPIIRITTISFILGVLIALLLPKEYSSDIVLKPEQPSSTASIGGGASSLLRQFGIGNSSLGMSGELPYFDPYYFSYIQQSGAYQLDIMNTEIKFSNLDSTATFYEYFMEIAKPGILNILYDYSIGLIFKLKSQIFGSKNENLSLNTEQESEYLTFSKAQKDIAGLIRSRISIRVEELTGITTISTEMPDPLAAADLCVKVKQYLEEFSSNYATEKGRKTLEFVQSQYDNAKQEFYNAQNNLASFRDRNRNVQSAMIRTTEERLQNEYQIAYEVYLGLAQQLEQAKLKVQEDTPVFSILIPSMVPLEKAKPRRALIVITFLVFGLLISTGYYSLRKIFNF